MRLAVIPARGGSKRIPRKNIKPFCGKPVIAYAIEAALASGCFDEVIVSTDDQEIGAVARAHGAQTPFERPATLADDHTVLADVVNHAIRWLGERSVEATEVCCVFATAPFLTPSALRAGLQALRTPGRSFALSVTSFPYPVQRALRMGSDGSIDALYPEHRLTRSQDLEPGWHDAGQFCWGTSDAFLRKVPVFSPATAGVVLPRHMVQDLDTHEDWSRAELMYQVLRSHGELP